MKKEVNDALVLLEEFDVIELDDSDLEHIGGASNGNCGSSNGNCGCSGNSTATGGPFTNGNCCCGSGGGGGTGIVRDIFELAAGGDF